MTQDSNAKDGVAIVPQSPITRHLGLIKAMSVIMAILIVTALVVIAVTIYSRLTTSENSPPQRQSSIELPEGARVISASFGDNAQLLLLVDHNNRHQLLQFDNTGRLLRQIEIRTSIP